jgi:hypothetical protein
MLRSREGIYNPSNWDNRFNWKDFKSLDQASRLRILKRNIVSASTTLLSDTKIPKNIFQQIIGSDFTRDLSKEIERTANVHRHKIIGDLIV